MNNVRLLQPYAVCACFVLLWMACEFYFQLSPLQNQFLGVPLIVLFQLAIARRPLREIWARDPKLLQVDRVTLAIAATLSIGCGALLWLGSGRVAVGLDARLSLFGVVIVGVIPAAFALRTQNWSAFRRAGYTMAAAIVLRLVWYAAWHPEGSVMFPATKTLDFLTLWLCEFVALFIFDEVAFRGALDPYLARTSKGRLHEWCSATFISILWAIWHLRAYKPGAETFLELFSAIGPFSIFQVVLGTLLSFCARTSRNLVPGSVAHAFGNAYVLAMMKP
jgi:hypothetical protein